ncbi:MAG: hypothetical protein ACRD18_11535 [Terriglobia bacterium]
MRVSATLTTTRRNKTIVRAELPPLESYDHSWFGVCAKVLTFSGSVQAAVCP